MTIPVRQNLFPDYLSLIISFYWDIWPEANAESVSNGLFAKSIVPCSMFCSVSHKHLNYSIPLTQQSHQIPIRVPAEWCGIFTIPSISFLIDAQPGPGPTLVTPRCWRTCRSVGTMSLLMIMISQYWLLRPGQGPVWSLDKHKEHFPITLMLKLVLTGSKHLIYS